MVVASDATHRNRVDLGSEFGQVGLEDFWFVATGNRDPSVLGRPIAGKQGCKIDVLRVAAVSRWRFCIPVPNGDLSVLSSGYQLSAELVNRKDLLLERRNGS